MPTHFRDMQKKISDSLLQSDVEQSAALVTSKGAVAVDISVLTFLANEKGYKGVVLCIDRPHSFYVKMLEANGVSQKGMRFINVGFKETGENVTRIGDNPGDLTFIKIELVRTAQKMRLDEPNAKLFVLNDAVTTMLLYSDERTVGQFLHDVNNKLRELDVYEVNVIEPEEKLGTIIRKLADVVVEMD